MAIAGLKRLSLNRNSFIGVKKLFFRNDQDKIDCFIRFLDSFTLTYITLFKVIRFYIEIKALSGLDGMDLNHLETALIKIIKYIRQKREEFLLYNRFHSFKDSINKFYMNLHVLQKEFKNFIQMDLFNGLKPLNRNHMLDMYNYDLMLFIDKIIPSIITVIDHFQSIIDGMENLDTYLVGVNTMIITEFSNKITKMIDDNQPLIKKFINNDLSITQFHIKRNESSLKYLQLNESIESIMINDCFSGNQLITLEIFQKFIITDSIYILEKLLIHSTSIINQIQSSLDLFFKLSNLLEVHLNNCFIKFQNIKLDPFINTTENLIESCEIMIDLLTELSKIIKEIFTLPEFKSMNFSNYSLKFNILTINYQFFNQILTSNQRITNDLDKTDKFQNRFKISIDSLNCGIMGLESLIDHDV
ncbi:hypothetical protein BN7_4755 [Wickerhamomyces ciferrii]|uniref:Uncharacterized protein n=1 Tax=Wickerhamomyces ciferrii (strain ATCC 14091 / BCRC 22168 / CBS 111 / JCM 3599 / NBRC 0793 / NRRL Y-1031 F-60-10) TaxID=1206466 RepID=K0KUR6_WICCF|nr:uncharacterized protein BN7_4755 [Wickerhamomyces ciferrii]CCH45174.1 hypothetical protein BN7_4755 [Wickerhamomyces ciferrii]